MAIIDMNLVAKRKQLHNDILKSLHEPLVWPDKMLMCGERSFDIIQRHLPHNSPETTPMPQTENISIAFPCTRRRAAGGKIEFTCGFCNQPMYPVRDGTLPANVEYLDCGCQYRREYNQATHTIKVLEALACANERLHESEVDLANNQNVCAEHERRAAQAKCIANDYLAT